MANAYPGELECIEVKVLTLNCWGLRYVSRHRVERIQAIADHLATGVYDIVLLQEVWNDRDFQLIRERVANVLPFSHFFDNGIIGTGTCIFTKVQINDATFHEFSMNGYPHRIFHGDWFGGKGLGVCQIYFQDFDIHIYTSHYHAEYDPMRDVYLGHRVIHALESAQWIKLASSSADLTIYGGDFNTEPTSVPYKLVRRITPMIDAWAEVHGDNRAGGETCDIPSNSFSHPSLLLTSPQGKRIDYIMYRPGPNIKAETIQCSLPLPSRIPGRDFSYSDHEAVFATIRVTRKRDSYQPASEFRRLEMRTGRRECVMTVIEAQDVLRQSEKTVVRDKFCFWILVGITLILLVASFIPLTVVDIHYHAPVEIGLFLPRCVLTVIFIFFILMATLFNQKEINSLHSAAATLRLIHDQDLVSGNDNPLAYQDSPSYENGPSGPEKLS